MDELLTRKQAAKILSKPESWLRFAERKRLVPYVKIGHHIRYRLRDLEAWVREQRVMPKKEGEE